MDYQTLPDSAGQMWNTSTRNNNLNNNDNFSNYPISSPLSTNSNSSNYSIDSGYSGMTQPPSNNVVNDQPIAFDNFIENDTFNGCLQDFYDPQAPVINFSPFPPSIATVPTDTFTSECTQSPVMPLPYLEIVEQPLQPFRFRYKSEMHGTHGSLMGIGTERSKKTYPTVALRNFGYASKAMIRCSLYQVPSDTKPNRVPHSHRLISRHNDTETSDPHDREVSSENDFTAVFDGMGIIHTAKRHIKGELSKKIRMEKEFEWNRELTLSELASIDRDADKQAKEMNLNQVCLCYQAYIKHEADNIWVKICDPVYSNIVNNLKSALYGGLRITRMSTYTSEAKGGQEIFMFVEKVCKNNIKVKFFEMSETEGYWEAFGVFNESDVHHQYGIVLRTPPYRNNASIQSPVTVMVQLYRPKDDCTSEPIEFRYRPNAGDGRKRRRCDSVDFIPTVVGSHETQSQDGSGFFGANRQNHGSSYGFGSNKFNQTDHNENDIGNDESMFQDSLPNYFGSFSTADLCLSSVDLKGFWQCSTEEFSRLLDVEVGGESKLQVDGAGGNTKVDYYDTSTEITCPLLDKLKMLIKLFKNNFDPERLHDMMMVLIKAQDETGENILLDCIQHGTVEEIRVFVLILVKYKLMDVLKSVNDLDQNCFHLLIIAGFNSLLKVFLNLDVDVNHADAFGQTPLHLAVIRNAQDSLIDLLEHSSKIKLNELNDDGFTPLHLAVLNDNLTFVRLLIKAGADILKKSPPTGNNVLHMAAVADNTNMEMIATLIGHNEELLHQVNNSQVNPLQIALENGKKETLTKHLETYYRESYAKADATDGEEDDCSTSESDNEVENESTEPLFDERCFKELCEIFDENNNWKGILILLGLEDKIDDFENNTSPSRGLFNYLDETKKSLNSILEIFDMMDEKRAVNVIDEMLVRKFNKL